MLDFIGSALNLLAGIILIVLGLRARNSEKPGAISVNTIIVLGIVVVLSGFLLGLPDMVEGWGSAHTR